MNPYFLFIGDYYYPDRWNDFVGDFDTLEQAEKYIEKAFPKKYVHKWYQIVDIRIKKVVKEGDVTEDRYE